MILRPEDQKTLDDAAELVERCRNQGVYPTSQKPSQGWFGRNKTWLLSTGSVAFGAALGYGIKAKMNERAAKAASST